MVDLSGLGEHLAALAGRAALPIPFGARVYEHRHGRSVDLLGARKIDVEGAVDGLLLDVLLQEFPEGCTVFQPEHPGEMQLG